MSLGSASLVEKRRTRGSDSRQYRLVPPIRYQHHEGDVLARRSSTNVLVLHHYTGQAKATSIFPCDYYGRVRFWDPLPGSFTGDWDHVRALMGAGYEALDDGSLYRRHSVPHWATAACFTWAFLPQLLILLGLCLCFLMVAAAFAKT
jgi:hypothetical protein